MSSAATQFPSQLGSGHALGEPADDEDDLRGVIMSPLEHGPRPGIEDASTDSAPIVEDGCSIVAVDEEPVWRLAARTTEPLRVEQVEEEMITGILIHQMVDREIQGSVSGLKVFAPSFLEIDHELLLGLKGKTAPI